MRRSTSALELLAGDLLDRDDLDVGVGSREAGDQVGHDRGRHVARDADPQRSGRAGADAGDDGLEALDALDDAARLLEHERPRGRQLHAAGGADQQLEAERRLERS